MSAKVERYKDDNLNVIAREDSVVVCEIESKTR